MNPHIPQIRSMVTVPPLFAYVVTGDSLATAWRYVSGASLSILSLRRHHPDAVIVCLSDEQIHRELVAVRHPLLRLADRIEMCPDAFGGPVHRSRYLKTTLRQRLQGPFLYLDSDTLVVGPLDDITECSTDASFTIDRFFPAEPGAFPAWLTPHYRHLGWRPTNPYYAGGIFRVAATEAAQRLFEAWHENWQRTVDVGIVSDQPSLNRAIATCKASVQLLPEKYNRIVGREAFVVSPDTCVISFLASRRSTMAHRYVALLQRFESGESVDLEDIAELTAVGTAYPACMPSFLSEWTRRIAERVGQTTARSGWRRASRE